MKRKKQTKLYPYILQPWIFQNHKWARKFKKVQAKNLMKWINFTDFVLDIFHFLKVFDVCGKYSKKNREINLIDFTCFFGLHMLKFSGQLCHYLTQILGTRLITSVRRWSTTMFFKMIAASPTLYKWTLRKTNVVLHSSQVKEFWLEEPPILSKNSIGDF